mgnify:CR=1 FL=1
MRYQDYSTERKAEVIAIYHANQKNLKFTARQVGVDPETIRYWLRSGIEFQPAKAVQLTEKLDGIAHQCADLLPNMLPEASVREVVGAMGQSIQLSQLLKGLPTQITETVDRQELAVILQSALSSCMDAELVAPDDPE